MADEEVKTQVAEEPKPVQEEPKAVDVVAEQPKQEAPTAQSNQDISTALSEIKTFLAGAASPKEEDNLDERLARLEEEYGFNKKQINLVATLATEIAQKVVDSNTLNFRQDMAKDSAKKVLGQKYQGFMKEVEDEMKDQPSNVKANPQMWERVAAMVIGKNVVRGTAPVVVKSENGTVKVTGVNMLNSPNPTNQGKSNRDYSESEKKMIDMYFGGDADNYEKHSKEKNVESLRSSKDERPRFK